MEVKKKTLYVWAFVIVLLVGGIFVFVRGGSDSTGNVVGEDGVQKVVIGMNGYNYYPNVVRVKAGVPVELSLDDSVSGCFRDLIIPELKLKKYLAISSDTLTFTLDKGTYTFACSMYLGQGKIIAE